MQAHKNEKSSGGKGVTKFEILSATMVGRRRKFLISNRLKELEKFIFAGGGQCKFSSHIGVY